MRQYDVEYGKNDSIGFIKPIIYLLITVFIFLVGYHYLFPHQGSKMDISPGKYRSLTTYIDVHQLDYLEKSTDNHAGIYTTLMLMHLAKTYVSIDQLEKAECLLKRSLDTSQDGNISAVITLRLARVRLQQNKLDLAKEAIDSIDNNNWQAIRSNLLGDILSRQGFHQKAYSVWNNSIIQNNFSSINQLMQMKANNIA
jgi:predicted negative regulator of RcsB-dependent stress response